MSTVKISELVYLPSISANTSNTIFLGVDLPTRVTGRFTATTLAQQLFANNYLVVGQNYQTIFPNTVGQISGTDPTFLQFNLQNFSNTGSGDFVVTADNGTNSNNFIDMGINGSKFADSAFSAMYAYDGYLYSHGPTDQSAQGNLVIGTATSGANIVFIAGGTQSSNIVATLTKTGLVFNTKTKITFPDGTTMNTAAFAANYTQASFDLANTNSNSITFIAGVNAYQNTYSNAAFAKANAALANTSGTFAGDLTITGNVSALSSNSGGVIISNNTIYSVLTGQDLVIGQTAATANLVVNRTINLAKDLVATGNIIAAGIQSTTGAIATGNLVVNGTANVSGTMNVVGKVSLNSQVIMTNTNYSATESALTITATPSYALPANDGYMVHISGKNGVPSRIVSDSYGTGAYSVYASRTARGTVSSPSAVQTNDIIGRFSANGYGATKFQQYGTGRIDFVATENYTDANTGSQIQFWNCPVGTNTLTQIATFNGSSVTFTGVVNPQKGFIWSPTIYPGAQTAITIDFANNSVIKCNTSAGLTVSFSNYTAGKTVKFWITNTSGFTQTFTHGCTALNSTVNATTYSIPSTSTICCEYISFDGDLANTFVSIIHA